MNNFWTFIKRYFGYLRYLRNKFSNKIFIKRLGLGYYAPDTFILSPVWATKPQNIYLYENTNVFKYSKFIMVSAKFIMKKNSGAAEGLTVVTGNHISLIGSWFKDFSGQHIGDIEKDVVVEEDVWLGTNVTLLSGVIVGRGAIVGAGTVCRLSVPPYAIAIGNPAKVVGFKFTPEEIIEHEKKLYPTNERLPLMLLEKNYKKYFLDKGDEIRDYLKL